jgi:hypothetical protein
VQAGHGPVSVIAGNGAVAAGAGVGPGAAVVGITAGVVTLGAGVVTPGVGVIVGLVAAGGADVVPPAAGAVVLVAAGGEDVVPPAGGAVGVCDGVPDVVVLWHAVSVTPNITTPIKNFRTTSPIDGRASRPASLFATDCPAFRLNPPRCRGPRREFTMSS